MTPRSHHERQGKKKKRGEVAQPTVTALSHHERYGKGRGAEHPGQGYEKLKEALNGNRPRRTPDENPKRVLADTDISFLSLEAFSDVWCRR